MPRTPSEKMIEAEKLFNDGIAMVEIAKKLGVSDGTVRSWKNRYGWGDKSKKTDATLQKKMVRKLQRCKRKRRADGLEIKILREHLKARVTQSQYHHPIGQNMVDMFPCSWMPSMKMNRNSLQ